MTGPIRWLWALSAPWVASCGGARVIEPSIISAGADSSDSGAASATTVSPGASSSGDVGPTSTGLGLADSDSSDSSFSTTGPAATGSSSGSGSSGLPTSAGGSSEGETNLGGLPDGQSCREDGQCLNDRCFVVGPLGGVCSQCLVDADCPSGGCSAAGPTIGQPAVCNFGELGGGCETSAVCADGLVCSPLYDVPGIVTLSTCGECQSGAPCPAGQSCQPSYDIQTVSGSWTCVEPGTLPNGSGCDLNPSGNLACVSGQCSVATFMDLLVLGVCGECGPQVACSDGLMCQNAQLDLVTGFTPSMCVAP